MEGWRSFLTTYFGWRPTLAQIVWTILTLIGVRTVLWMWHQSVPRGELIYWAAGFPVILVFWAAVSYATKSTAQPQLSATIDRIHVMGAAQITSAPEHAHYVALLFVISVKNSGTPSVADRWKLSISLAGAKGDLEAIGIAIQPNSIMQVNDNVTKKAINYVGVDALYNKAVMTPISTGAIVRGLLLWIVDNVSEAALTSPGTQYHLSFVDILGKVHKSDFTWPAVLNRSTGYIAGLTQAIDMQQMLPLVDRPAKPTEQKD
jgi:hypothetical protein